MHCNPSTPSTDSRCAIPCTRRQAGPDPFRWLGRLNRVQLPTVFGLRRRRAVPRPDLVGAGEHAIQTERRQMRSVLRGARSSASLARLARFGWQSRRQSSRRSDEGRQPPTPGRQVGRSKLARRAPGERVLAVVGD